MTMPDLLVQDYLRRLDAASAVLPPDRRGDLLEAIREHIADARAAGAGDEAATRSLLARLGEPEDIVGAAQEEFRDDAPPLGVRGTGRELAAVLLLTLGSLFPPLVGWLAGVALLWSSPLWRVREKLLGTLVWPGGAGGVLLLGGALTAGVGFGDEQCVTQGSTTTCTSGSLVPVSGLALLAVVLPPLVVAVLLYRTARRRAATQPRPAAPGGAWSALEVTGVALLGLGGLLLPLVLPLVGLLLVLLSPAWTRRDKAVGALLTALPLLLAVVGGAVAAGSGVGGLGFGPAELGLLGGYLGLLLGSVVAAVWFLVRFRRS